MKAKTATPDSLRELVDFYVQSNKTYTNELGQKIADILSAKIATKTAISRALGVSPTSIYNWLGKTTHHQPPQPQKRKTTSTIPLQSLPPQDDTIVTRNISFKVEKGDIIIRLPLTKLFEFLINYNL